MTEKNSTGWIKEIDSHSLADYLVYVATTTEAEQIITGLEASQKMIVWMTAITADRAKHYGRQQHFDTIEAFTEASQPSPFGL